MNDPFENHDRPHFRAQHPYLTSVQHIEPEAPGGQPMLGVEAAQAAPAQAGGATGGKAETVTPVMPIYSSVTHPFQDCVNVVMPYKRILFNQSLSMSSTAAATDVYSFTFRLNSPVDVMTEYTFAANPTYAADALSGTAQRPMYYNYWSGFYRYYTVTQTTYKITIVPNGGSERKYSAWTYHHGMQGPFLIGPGPGFVRKQDQLRAFDKHARCTPIVERAGNSGMPVADRTKWDVAKTISGMYRPGRISVQNDVVEDDLAKTWHPVGEVPPLKELCTLVVQRADDQMDSGNAVFQVTLEMEIHCQFRDLRWDFEGPGNTANLPAIADWSTQTNMYL